MKQKSLILVSMPWAGLSTPSIQISLLKSIVEAGGRHVSDLYANIRLREWLSFADYSRIAYADVPLIVGEWLFSPCLYSDNKTVPKRIESNTDYLDYLTSIGRLPDKLRDRLITLRNDTIPRYIDHLAESVPWADYDVAGFSCVYSQVVASIALARKLKQRFTQLQVILGGAQCDNPMGQEYLRAFPWIDYVVIGYAERSLPALMARLDEQRDGSDIAGVASRRGNQVVWRPDRSATSLDNLPIPNFDTYFQLERNWTERTPIPIESSRGCWWGQKSHCTFCGIAPETMPFAAKSPDRVFQEMKTLARRHQILDFVFTDYIMDHHFYKTLLPRLAAAGLGFNSFFELKTNISRENVQLLRRAGVLQAQPGIESFSSHVLKLMRKGATALQNIQLLRWCREFGIELTYNILWGFPGELTDDYEKQIHLLDWLVHLPPPTFEGPVVIHRFSPLFTCSNATSSNIRPREDYYFVFDPASVSIESVAYEFDVDTDEKLKPYYMRLREKLRSWRARYRSKRPFLEYRQGPDFLQIEDTRGEQFHVHTFERPFGEIYLFCAERARTLGAIKGWLSDRGYGDVDVDRTLTEFIKGGLMYDENGQYLSLAVPHPVHAVPLSVKQATAAATDAISMEN